MFDFLRSFSFRKSIYLVLNPYLRVLRSLFFLGVLYKSFIFDTLEEENINIDNLSHLVTNDTFLTDTILALMNNARFKCKNKVT